MHIEQIETVNSPKSNISNPRVTGLEKAAGIPGLQSVMQIC
jgi:hypothetical protein